MPWRSLFLRRSLNPRNHRRLCDELFSCVHADAGNQFIGAPRFLRRVTAALQQRPSRCADSPRPHVRAESRSAEAERAERIASLIPGLSHEACSRMTPIRWPDQYITTAMVTPIQFNDTPYSALIYYDWSETGTQLILPYQGSPPALQGVISLKKNVGYRMRLPPKGNGSCAAVLPGLVKPDWMTAASCECQGVIQHNATLSPIADSPDFVLSDQGAGSDASCGIGTQPKAGRSCSRKQCRRAAA